MLKTILADSTIEKQMFGAACQFPSLNFSLSLLNFGTCYSPESVNPPK